MEMWITLLLIIGFMVYIMQQMKHALHMFQQNRYEIKRYIPWIQLQCKQNRKGLAVIVIKEFLLVGLLFVSLLFSLNLYMLVFLYLAIFAVMGILNALQEKQEHYIKPLVYTSRVKRQEAVMVLLNIVYAFLICRFVPYLYWAIPFMLGNVLQWVWIIIMQQITMPMEYMVRRYYLNDAKRLLEVHQGLQKVGITGSFGKTSSKHVLQEILSEKYYSLMTPASFNTPMGITITIREQLKPLHEVFICEMGADKVGEIDYLTKFVQPQMGVITSIGPQHLQTFGSLENIIQEKFKMIENLPPSGVGFLNYDNPYIRDYAIQNTCKIVTYGCDHEDVDFYATDIVYAPTGSTFTLVLPNKERAQFQTRLLGKHNIMNILAAIAVGSYMGISMRQLQTAVARCKYIEHRLQVKHEMGVTWIDNAFNSNPIGAKMSMEVMKMMPGTRYVITPGLIDLGASQGSYNQTFGAEMLGCVDEVYLVGIQQTKAILSGLQSVSFPSEHIHVFATVQEAFHQVRMRAKAGDTVLLENDLPDAFNK